MTYSAALHQGRAKMFAVYLRVLSGLPPDLRRVLFLTCVLS